MVKLTIFVITTIISTIFGYAIDSETAPNADARIVGGNTAVEGQFPYQISIKLAEDDSHYCGGSILNSRWILTAAHCVSRFSPSDLYIFAGSVSLTGNGIRSEIATIIIYEGYSSLSLNNDIALIEVEEEIEFSTNIQPIELETQEVGEVDCVVSGWGLLAAGGDYPETLQYMTSKTITPEECQGLWGSSYAAEREVCTLSSSGEGFCSGDSGGPLAANGRQIGVVAWTGFPCGGSRPDVFTKVSAFSDWIADIIN